jgi:hypothetical protein
VERHADILKVARNLVFSQDLVPADGTPVVRASGVFKRGPLLPESSSDVFMDPAWPAGQATASPPDHSLAMRIRRLPWFSPRYRPAMAPGA